MLSRFACSTVLLPAMMRPVPIDQHGAACAMVAQGLCERRAPAIGPAVGIMGVRVEIRQSERVTDGSC